MMELAQRLDDLKLLGRARIVESETGVIVSDLVSASAVAIARDLEALGWTFEALDRVGGVWAIDDLAEAFAPYTLHIDKPQPVSGVFVLTNTAFSTWLIEQKQSNVWQVGSLTRSFSTWGSLFCPFDEIGAFEEHPATKDPREVVRENGAHSLVPNDIRPWLLEASQEPPLEDGSFQAWMAAATPFLLRALCSEVLFPTGRLSFRGPPRVQLSAPESNGFETLEQLGFFNVQEACRWVYENSRETEVRHALFSAEFARSAGEREITEIAFKDICDGVLESSKIAYQLSISELGRDTLKSLAELRKAVTEEVSKTSDTTRQIITAVGGSLSIGIGLVAAKISSVGSPIIIIGLAIVLVIYVLFMGLSGVFYLGLQRNIRSDWRSRLYSFLSSSEYKKMVSQPLFSAAINFYAVAGIGFLLSVSVLALVTFAHPASPSENAENPTVVDLPATISVAEKATKEILPNGQMPDPVRESRSVTTEQPMANEKASPQSEPIIPKPKSASHHN